MSMRYKGGVISATPPTTSTSSAPGIWTLEQQMQAQAAGTWPVPPITWVGAASSTNTGTNDYATGVITDASGNVFVLGYSNAGSSRDIVISKYNKSGVRQWQYVYGYGSFSDTSGYRGIKLDSSGNIYVCGTVGYPNNEIVVVKFDSSCNILWQKTFSNGATSDTGNAIHIDSSSNVYIVGSLAGTTAFVAKINTSGTLQFQRTLSSGTSTISYNGVATDSAGNVYCVGSSNATGDQDGLMVKYNSSGTLQWQQRVYYGINADYITNIVVGPDGYLYVCGAVGVFSTVSAAWVAKFDINGSWYWSQAFYNITYSSFFNGISIGSDGYIYLSGRRDQVGFLVKYNTSGTMQWARYISYGSGVYLSDVSANASGLYSFAGFTYTNSGDFVFASLLSSGGGQGSWTLNSWSFDYSTASVPDSARTIYTYITSLTSATGTATEGTPTGTVTSSALPTAYTTTT